MFYSCIKDTYCDIVAIVELSGVNVLRSLPVTTEIEKKICEDIRTW